MIIACSQHSLKKFARTFSSTFIISPFYSTQRYNKAFTTGGPFRNPAMSPIAVQDIVDTPVYAKKDLHNPTPTTTTSPTKPAIVRCDANDPSTTTDHLISILERDGGVIVENIITKELASRIKSELKPYFDTDKKDNSGFFPETTQRATGLLGRSDACVELATNKTYIDVANKMLSSTFTYWSGQTQETVTSKPIISS